MIVDERLLKQIRSQCRCALCGKRKLLQAAHVMSRGAGRVDIRGNLLALCADCHRMEHDGNITKDELLDLSARMDGVDPEIVRDTVNLFRRIPKGHDVQMAIISLCEDPGVIQYARRCWESHTKGRRIKR